MNDTAPPTSVLEVRDLRVTFGSEAGSVEAVRGLSLDLVPGRTTAIVGESGSGKSVSAMAILGLLPDHASVSGSVRLRGDELLGRSDAALSRVRGADIGMIFQDPMSSLTPVFTVGAQITEALRVHRSIGKKQADERAVELLDMVGIPDPRRRAAAFPHELSGGMRQRVMIAMAIANDPAVLIADEPTTALDVTIQAQILSVLAAAQRETGAALLLITHDLGVVAGTADEVLVMYGGRTVESGDVDTVFHEPRMPYTIGLLGAVPRLDRLDDALIPIPGTPPVLIDPANRCQFEPRCPIAVDECRSAEPQLRPVGDVSGAESAMSHRAACVRADDIVDARIAGDPVFAIPDLPAPTAADRTDEGEPALRVRGLRREFPLTSGLLKRRIGTVRAVNGISFDIRRGETLAIVGESGSGKSTTLLEVMDFSQPAGVVRVGGVDPADLGRRAVRTLRRDLSIVFQDPAQALDPRLTAFEVIAEPLRVTGMSRGDTESRVVELMGLVGLDPAQSDRFPVAFSGGQRQRIAIARALALDPGVIVLDEPLSALDVSVQADIVNLIRRLQRATGVAYLVVAHDLSVIRHLADRVAVMYLGEFVEVGTAERIFAAPLHPYTRALISAVPVPDPRVERERRPIVLRGESPSPADVPAGCAFVGRCPLHPTLDPDSAQRCRTTPPALRVLPGYENHEVACHFAETDR